MLFDIHKGRWDEELLALLDIPSAMLPEVRDCAADFGDSEPLACSAAPIAIGYRRRPAGGDRRPGLLRARHAEVDLWHRLLRLAQHRHQGRHLEEPAALDDRLSAQGQAPPTRWKGSIFIAGAAVQWLRDGLGIIEKASDSGPLAAKADPGQQVYLVPAFTGLGAPHWDADARGAIFGLTRNTGPREFARAALDSVCFQTLDLLDAMRSDWPEADGAETVLRVDGGMVASDWTMQRLADILAAPVDRPQVLETTALGAAYLAGLDAGLLPEPTQFADRWRLERRFSPGLAEETRRNHVAGWRDAVRRTLSSA
jgi:glycerol kinase